MRVLLDESVPRQLAGELRAHDVQTVVQAGWGGVQNGELLRLASAEGFEALITLDRNLQRQQNIPRSGLALVVILAPDSRVSTVLALAEAVRSALDGARPGAVLRVGA